MPTRLGKMNTDINVWGAVNNDAIANTMRMMNTINIAYNSNTTPPIIKAGTSFTVYAIDTQTSAPATPTGNNVYPANTSLIYYDDSVIFELVDVTLAWGTAAGSTSAGTPSVGTSTSYYVYCTGSQDVDATSRGKGRYGISTNAPSYDYIKKGWYSADGLVIHMYKTDGSQHTLNTAGNWLTLDQYNKGYIAIVDSKSANTAGGTFTSGSDQKRDLTQIDAQTIYGITISASQIVGVPAGTYRTRISCPGWRCASHQAKLYNVTGSAALLVGTSEYNSSSVTASNKSFIDDVFTLTATSTLEVRHRCTTTEANDGFGYPANIGNNEIYTTVYIEKLS